MQIVLGVAAFVMSIAWLNIEANEVVSLLQAFGLLCSIDTGEDQLTHTLVLRFCEKPEYKAIDPHVIQA